MSAANQYLTQAELFDLARIVKPLRESGTSMRAIAAGMGLSKDTAYRLDHMLRDIPPASRAELVAAAQPWRQRRWSAKDGLR